MYKKYIYGSAEVVGLMCLKVFVKNQPDLFQELSPYALSLGSAFQKINFLRDLQSDYIERGRTYFPSLKLMSFSNEDKENIENEISQDFNHAFIGIQKLPKNSKLGVYLAYKYYSQLLFKIKKSSAQMILRNRIRVSEIKKAEIMMRSMKK